jgi:alpha-tubulin suppressor-like RCC1 family protein
LKKIVVTCIALVANGAVVAVPATASTSATGQLYAFGYSGYGQAGQPASGPGTLAQVSLPGATGSVAQVATGGDFSLAVTSNGQLFSFGDNSCGQLGYSTGEATWSSVPKEVTLPDGNPPVTQVAAGENFSLALAQPLGQPGELFAFGCVTAAGQPGQPSGGTSTLTPVQLQGASGGVTEIAAGGNFGLAVTGAHQLFAFGVNYSGQLGTSSNIGTLVPTTVQVSLTGVMGSIVQVAAGLAHSLVLTDSGNVYGFGSNFYGQLGSQTDISKPVGVWQPTLVPFPRASTKPQLVMPGPPRPVMTGTVRQVAAGGNHSLALTSTGQIWSFGSDEQDQLGYDSGGSGVLPTSSPPTLVPMPPGSTNCIQISPKCIQIAAGLDFTLVLTTSGNLYGFGDNQYGQLGTGYSGSYVPAPQLLDFGAESPPFKAVSEGSAALHVLVTPLSYYIAVGPASLGRVLVPYVSTLKAFGGSAPYSWAATGLPPELSMNPLSGVVSGLPLLTGNYMTRVSVIDDSGYVYTQSFTIRIVPYEPPPTDSALSRLTISPLVSQLSHVPTSLLPALKTFTVGFVLSHSGYFGTLPPSVTVTFRVTLVVALVTGLKTAKPGEVMATFTHTGVSGANSFGWEDSASDGSALGPGAYLLTSTVSERGLAGTQRVIGGSSAAFEILP